ncbi:MAG: hypothetical protein ACRDPF_32810 [Streptosporangiaceae bacterium]
MHPVIMRELAADRIREMHAKAEDNRQGRRAGLAEQGAAVFVPRPRAPECLTPAKTT